MLISNSEVSTFQTCERKHYYAFREALKPQKGHGVALTRGIVGHEVFEAFYASKMHGERHEDCIGFAKEVLDNNIRKYSEYAKELGQLHSILVRYADFYRNEPWKVLEVEDLHSLRLDAEIDYGLRLDLLVEVTAGREKGQVQIIDHKFVYDFFNDRELAMNTQLVKYIKALRDNGIPARKGVLNQIRYRQMKNNDPSMMFRRSSVVTTDLESRRFMEEFHKVANDISVLTGLPKSAHRDQTRMHIDKQTCSSCAFQPLCKLTLQGLDEQSTKKMLYKHNDYVDQYRK